MPETIQYLIPIALFLIILVFKEDLPDHGIIANEVEEVIKHLYERLRNDDNVLIAILNKMDVLSVDG